ncbi:MAG: hypothetical protein ACRD00_01235 [Thermoanaerobaculia bacterium]
MTPSRVKAARAIAVAADFLQIVMFPAFWPGAASPWNDGLDALVAVAMLALVGWHWAFLPSFLAELVPVLDLVPTWTAAVFFVTRGQGKQEPAPDAIDTEVLSSSPSRKPNA